MVVGSEDIATPTVRLEDTRWWRENDRFRFARVQLSLESSVVEGALRIRLMQEPLTT